MHGPEETPLKYAQTNLAGRIARPHGDGEATAGTVNQGSLKDYVCASLGMPHNADKIDPALRLYLDALSRNESPSGAQPVTHDSFTLLCILHMADQEPGPAYGAFTRDAFMEWLNGQLTPATVRDDLIPGEYFETVQVSRTHSNRCDVRYGGDANPVVVQAIQPFVLGDRADLACANLRRANLSGANLWRADLSRALLDYADLSRANMAGADLQGARLANANLQSADLRGADLEGAWLTGAKLQGAKLDVTAQQAVGLVFSVNHGHLVGTRLALSTENAESSCQRSVREEMVGWCPLTFDLYLSHHRDGHSVLKNIAHLDDSCPEAKEGKQTLMRAVVGELDLVRTEPYPERPAAVEALVPWLGDVLFEDPEYLRVNDAFAEWLCGRLLGDGSTRLDPELGDAALEALGRYATGLLKEKGLEAIKARDRAIYQVLYAMRERAVSGSSAEVREKWRAQSKALHAEYCYTLAGAYPSLMGDNSVYQNARLEDDNAFPLISDDGQSCVVMTEEHLRLLLLGDRFRIAAAEPRHGMTSRVRSWLKPMASFRRV
jgi:hypothetical protein